MIDSTLALLLGAGGRRGTSEADWGRYVAEVRDALHLDDRASIYDVSCEAGAFLWPLHEAGCRVGGLATSADHLMLARGAMPHATWEQGDAGTLDPATAWDFVVASGGFGELPDLAFARGVLARMAAKATTAIAVLNVPDAVDGPDPVRPGPRYTRGWFLRQLDEIGVAAVQFSATLGGGDDRFDVFARL
jgi:hypothetical protein